MDNFGYTKGIDDSRFPPFAKFKNFRLSILSSISFFGYGFILASSILRTSKNRYKVCLIYTFTFVEHTFCSWKVAFQYLKEKYYDEIAYDF